MKKLLNLLFFSSLILLQLGLNCNDLIEAVYNNNINKVQELINSRVNIDSRNSMEETPLIVAAKSGNLQIMRLLLQAGADVNAQDDMGLTPLNYVFSDQEQSNDFMDMVKLLLRYGAEVNDTLKEDIRMGFAKSEVIELLNKYEQDY